MDEFELLATAFNLISLLIPSYEGQLNGGLNNPWKSD